MYTVPDTPHVIDRFTGAYRFLSNMEIEPDGTYVEREFQADKTFDPVQRTRILSCDNPSESKSLGRAVTLRDDWESVKFQVMAEFVARKFHDHAGLARQLLRTGQALIIEGNDWHDNTWGDCRCGRPACQTPGLNWLGCIHMCVRTSLRLDTER